MALRDFRRFLDHLGQSRMGVDGGFDFVPGGFEVHGEADLGDHFGAFGADHVRANDLTVRFAVDDFDEAFRLTCRQGFAAGLVGEFADLVFEALLLRGALGETNAGNLRMAVGAAWEDADLLGLVLGKHAFDSLDGLVAGDVGEPRWPDDVAGAVDAFDVGFVAVVGVEPAAVAELQFDAAGQHGGDADGDEGYVGLDGFIGRTFDGDLDALAVLRGAGDLGVGEDANAGLGQALFQGLADLGVFHGKDVGLHLDDGHFGAIGVEEVGELDADSACADDDDALRLRGVGHGFLAADDGGAVEGETGHRAALRTSGDEDVRGVVCGLGAVSSGDFDFACGGDASGAFEVIDLVLFEKELDALVQLVRDATAAADDFGPVILDAADLEPELLGAMGEGVIKLSVFKQGFGRDTTPV